MGGKGMGTREEEGGQLRPQGRGEATQTRSRLLLSFCPQSFCRDSSLLLIPLTPFPCPSSRARAGRFFRKDKIPDLCSTVEAQEFDDDPSASLRAGDEDERMQNEAFAKTGSRPRGGGRA